MDSDLSDTDSSHSDDEDTEVEDVEGSDEGQSLGDSEVHEASLYSTTACQQKPGVYRLRGDILTHIM